MRICHSVKGAIVFRDEMEEDEKRSRRNGSRNAELLFT